MDVINHLNDETPTVQFLCAKDKRVAKLVKMVGPFSFCLHSDNPYSFLVHEIIEQMLSIKAGQQIFNRFCTLCENNISPSQVSNLSIDQISSVGMSNSKARSILALTNEILSGNIDLGSFIYLSDQEIIKQLTKVHGIGQWTAKMYLIFVLGRQDVLPYEDGAFLQVYRWIYKTKDCDSKSVIKKCQKWKPYSSIAARFFYRALDMGLTKNEFHMFKEV